MGTGGGGKFARRCATVASLKKLEKVPRERAGGGRKGSGEKAESCRQKVVSATRAGAPS